MPLTPVAIMAKKQIIDNIINPITTSIYKKYYSLTSQLTPQYTPYPIAAILTANVVAIT